MHLISISLTYGIRTRHAYKSMMHPYRGREWYPEMDSHKALYAAGYTSPNYTVPAIKPPFRGWFWALVTEGKCKAWVRGRAIRKGFKPDAKEP